MASRLSPGFLVVVLAVALAGCGGKSAEEKAKEQAAEASKPVCDMTQVLTTTKLPAGFPKPDAVTYHQQKTEGPSLTVDATYAGNLDDAYSAYEQAVSAASYTATHKEKEEDDAEINYEGGGTTGQIALRDVCGTEDKLVVHITNRPM
jgi:hypothetical protein